MNATGVILLLIMAMLSSNDNYNDDMIDNAQDNDALIK
jgi:hypothetical protein